MRNFILRHICLLISIMVALAATAQSKSEIASRITQSGQVTIDAPKGLESRSNSSLDRNDDSKKTTKTVKKDEKDDSLDELDDEHEKSKEKVESKQPKQPKREYTSKQTIQARGTGFRIQAYSDNNYKTAKSAAQARARAIAMKFPQYRSYISYNAPTWRLRLGDFKTHADAQAALARIRSVFPNYAREMTIVRDHINVWQ
ncbi:MAG: SPOR domain-containing protein [Muribaculaceae bacterium]|nr:SPOR domain-containing protein [Muribaculaceae bacterium]